MTHVVCRAAYCAHNLGGTLCNAREIEINEDTRYGAERTDCSTFIPRDFSGALLSLDNVNYAGLVEQAFSGMQRVNPQIQCLVSDCIYHEKKSCKADEIQVDMNAALSSVETFCKTYTT